MSNWLAHAQATWSSWSLGSASCTPPRPTRLCALLPACLLAWLLLASATTAWAQPPSAPSAPSAHPAPPPAAATIDLASWWVSPGEKKSLDILRRHAEKHGLRWQQRTTAGSGTSRFGDVLQQWIAQGNSPATSQVIGYDIHHWASQGKLAYLDDIAQTEEWDEVVPLGIQHLSKYQGHWVAAPINAHSTNWLWVNAALQTRLGLAAPDSWADFITLLQRAQAADMVPLAIGPDAWEHTLLFEAVAAGAGGAGFYRQAFLELNPQALGSPVVLQIFQRMRQLRSYATLLERTHSWDAATDQVRHGQALLQVQGSWVNGEYTAHRLSPGKDFQCWRFPDTQGMFLFNADQYMFFKGIAPDSTRQRFASVLLNQEMQTEMNIATGAVPARVDVQRERFNACGQRAISDLRRANLQRTLMGSIAMGNANPPAVKNAIYQVVSDHFLGKLSDAQAVQQLRAALAQAPSQAAAPAPQAP